MIQGKRVEWDGQSILNEGEYGKSPKGTWYCCTPGTPHYLGNLSSHSVTEHEDRTITVSPSILISAQDRNGKKIELWHGYLEKGFWRQC